MNNIFRLLCLVSMCFLAAGCAVNITNNQGGSTAQKETKRNVSSAKSKAKVSVKAQTSAKAKSKSSGKLTASGKTNSRISVAGKFKGGRAKLKSGGKVTGKSLARVKLKLTGKVGGKVKLGTKDKSKSKKKDKRKKTNKTKDKDKEDKKPATEPATVPEENPKDEPKEEPVEEIIEYQPPPEEPSENDFGYEEPVYGCFEGEVMFIEASSKKLPTDYSKYDVASVLYACEWNIPERSFSQGFPGVEQQFEWFAIRYSGAFGISQAGTYNFRINSDDGARLYIDGELVVDNDGVHPPKSKSGTIDLSTGDHEMVLEYFQGPRYHIALQLFFTPPDGEESIFSVR